MSTQCRSGSHCLNESRLGTGAFVFGFGVLGPHLRLSFPCATAYQAGVSAQSKQVTAGCRVFLGVGRVQQTPQPPHGLCLVCSLAASPEVTQ